MTVIDLGAPGHSLGEQLSYDTPPTGGVFVPAEVRQEYFSEIVDVRPYRDTERLEEGTVWYDQFTMSDETIYRVKTGLPHNLATDLPIDMTTPWWTAEDGHNTRAFLNFMSAGFVSRLYGPPRLHIPKGIRKLTEMPEVWKKAFAIDMGKDVHHYALIANELDDRYRHVIASKLAMWYGESRGAMEGIGAQARARLHGRTILFLEAVDACMEHEPEHGEVSLRDGMAELEAGARMFGHILFEPRRRHYRSTLDSSLSYLIPAVGTVRTLKSGLAGKFGDEQPLDAQAHLTFFDRSVGNQHASWIEKFRHHPGITWELLEGAHLTLSEREIIYRSLARLIEARNEYERHGVDLAAIDFEKVRAAQTTESTRLKPSVRFPSAA